MAIDKIDYYFKVVEAVALRGTCDRGRSGAIVVKDGRIVATGYVGAPSGLPHCDDVGHDLVKQRSSIIGGSTLTSMSEHCVRTVHAELNAIIQAARYGPPIDGAVMYCTMFPCRACAGAILNAGIVQVHAYWDYQKSEESKSILLEGGVRWTVKTLQTRPYGVV